MKIGIITHYYNSKNYGGNLQAYALCKYLSKNNNVEQICYVNVGNESNASKIKKYGLLKTAKKIFSRIIKKVNNLTNKKSQNLISANLQIRCKTIANFNSNIPHSNKVYNKHNIKEVSNEYDLFITGSDQVWHPEAICPAYVLDFTDKPKISYAASIATNVIPTEQKTLLENSLKTFKALSVREKSSCDILKGVGKNIEWVLDPVFLIDKEEWLDISGKRKIDDDYVFCYFLGTDKKYRKAVKEYAFKHHFKIVSMPYLLGEFNKADKGFADIDLYDVSPLDFVNLIINSKMVFTDSFHTSAFSCIFEKDFFVFTRTKYSSSKERMLSLSELFNIKERLCFDKKDISIYNFDNVKSKVFASDKYFELKKKSEKFLLDNIKDYEY